MKKLLLSLMITLGIVHVADAQYYDMPENTGALRIRLSNNAPMKVEIDRRHFGRHGSSLTIGDLPRGRHYIRIFEYDPYERHYSRLLYDGVVKIHKHMLNDAVLDLNTGFGTIIITITIISTTRTMITTGRKPHLRLLKKYMLLFHQIIIT
jgi:hypothetical protein